MYLKNYIQISFTCQILSILFKHIKILKGAHGVEPWTSRSAVECSTTELYPLMIKQVSMGFEIFKVFVCSCCLSFKWQCQYRNDISLNESHLYTDKLNIADNICIFATLNNEQQDFKTFIKQREQILHHIRKKVLRNANDISFQKFYFIMNI